MTKAQTIVKHMLENDAYSQWLGIDIIHVSGGACELSMQVRQEMTNGFGIAHGGIAYAVSDSALAFASNGHGRMAVSIETSIKHVLPVKAGDILHAKAEELHLSHKTAVYEVKVHNQAHKLVSIFSGTVYRKSEEWNLDF